jgi:hypothetical protein
MGPERIERAATLLRSVPGITHVRVVERPVLLRVAAAEERYGGSALLPVLNLGLRAVLERQLVLAVLKDRRFRPPPAPTVYLVEDLEGQTAAGRVEATDAEATGAAATDATGAAEAAVLAVGERRFRVLGEEVLDPTRVYAEKTMRLGGSFVVFPERRSSPKTPSYFLVPPLGFQELEEAGEGLGLERIISVSPSAPADGLLRELCGFPPDPAQATLLVAADALR